MTKSLPKLASYHSHRPYKTKKQITNKLLFLVFALTALIFLSFDAKGIANELEVGAAKTIITPKSFETWTDLNGNAKKEKDEPYNDTNKNGIFDAIYLAGFHQNRPANGVNDDIYAIATVIRSDGKTIGFVTLDVIGFMIDEVNSIRESIKAKLNLDHLVIHSLHNHEAPDTQGLWGKNLLSSGLNKDYMDYLKKQTIVVLEKAYKRLQPAEILHGEIKGQDKKFGVVDTRAPYVIERGIKTVVFNSKETKSPIATWIQFSNHVETIWSGNLEITADWPGYLRKAIEKGIKVADASNAYIEGLGGIASVFIGNIGGLATTLPQTPVWDEVNQKFVTEVSFDKVRAQGETLAVSVIRAYNRGLTKSKKQDIFIKKRTIDLRVQNNLFILAARIGILERNMKGVIRVTTKTELNHIGIGPIEILTIPGELYPEIAIGGVENLPGSDFDVEPIADIPLYSFMSGDINLMFNLTNDSIGYIIPYTEWDEKKPYLNLDENSSYGESNSIGSDAGTTIYKTARDLIINN